MKKHNKYGFTMAELILTTVIMAVVCVIAPVIILKRSVKPSVAKKFDFIAQCSENCIFDASTTRLKIGSNTSFDEQENIDYNKNSNDFYTIELIGAGGGGTSNSPGFPGESKVIYIPMLTNNEAVTGSNKADKYQGILTGYYLLEIGEGKKGESGEDTKICSIEFDKQDNKAPNSLTCEGNGKAIIATAKGGITSNEKVPPPQNSEISDILQDDYGKGGNKQSGESSGTGGTIIIK